MVSTKLLGINDLISDKRDAILQIAARYGASNVRVFGSVARGEARPDSDVDFLVDFKPDYRLFDLIGLKYDLEALLDRKVDIVSSESLREEIRPYVVEDLTSLETVPIILPKREKPFVREPKIYLRDILDRIARIETATVGGKTEFLGSELIQDAVIRNFEVIGEAAKQLPTHLTVPYPEVNWSKVAGFRDVLIHQYDKIDLEIVWENLTVYMPLLKAVVEAILKDLETPNET